jgi:hypothetical protein
MNKLDKALKKFDKEHNVVLEKGGSYGITPKEDVILIGRDCLNRFIQSVTGKALCDVVGKAKVAKTHEVTDIAQVGGV